MPWRSRPDTCGSSPCHGSSSVGLSVIPVWNAAVGLDCPRAKMRQRRDDLRRLEPRGVVGIHVGKHHKTVAIDDVRGRQRQHPTVGTLFEAIRVAERKIGGPELRRYREGDAITGGDPASRIPQNREASTAAAARKWRETDQRCAETLDFRLRLR